MLMSNKISRVIKQMFTKFLPDVEELLSSMLTEQSAFRYAHPLYNASTNNKGGVRQLVAVSRHKIGCHGNIP